MHALSRRLLLGSLAFSALACQNDFAPPSQIHGLRVLAVRPEPASGSPGANVHLELLFADSRPPDAMPPVSIAWLGGCHNPPSRQYYACLPALRRLANPSLGGDPAAPVEVPIGSGPSATSFDERLPDDILSAAPKLPSDAVHYGVSYVFFAACIGELSVDGASEFPLTCKTKTEDGTEGEPVGPSGFVIGFTTIYSYAGAENQNQNPVLASVNFDGTPVFASSPDALSALPVVTDVGVAGAGNDGAAGAADASGMNGAPGASSEMPTDCTAAGGVNGSTWLRCCQSDEDCAGVAFAHGTGCSSNHACAPVISACGSSGCPGLRIAPELDPASMESFTGGNEIVWASYYATLGSFDQAERLVVDRTNGLAENYAEIWHPPPADASGVARTARLWTTLNDQRGGATWGFFDVIVR